MCEQIYLQSIKDLDNQIKVDCLHSSINTFYNQKRCSETGEMPWYIVLENKTNKYKLKEPDILHLLYRISFQY